MEHPDEGTIHAWLDDALPVQESAAVAAHVDACADCAANVAEARGFIAASSRIVSALDDVPRGVLPQRETMVAASAPMPVVRARDARPAVRPWWARRQLAAAALLVVVAGSVYSVRDRSASVRDTAYESTDSVLSGPALAPSAAASPAPSPEALGARSTAEARVAQQSAAAPGATASGAAQNAAADAAVGASRSPMAAPRALSERADGRRETRKLEATMSATMSARASAPAGAATVAPPPMPPAVASPPLADAAPAQPLRKAPENDAIARSAQNQRAASEVAASRKTTGVVTAAATGAAAGGATGGAGQSFARAIPITPGCYATGAPGMPSRMVLTDSVVATVNARTWYRARAWPVSAGDSAVEWRWSTLETTAAELLAIVRGDTTSYRVSTAGRDASGCR